MNPILLAILSMGAVAAICGVILSVASKIMHVEVDETEAALRAHLPGANCGACGFAGCDGYAVALAKGEVATNLCTVGGDAVAREIAETLGTAPEDVAELVAINHCGGSASVAEKLHEYQGFMMCSGARMYFGGDSTCAYACLGYGDCALVCPNDAICIRDGVARINPRRCIGCGLCAKACPNHIISMVSDTVRVIVKCSSCDKAADVRQKCKAGCIACGKCEKECPQGAIKVENNLAIIDYDKCTGCGYCAEVCVVKCIKAADFTGAIRSIK